MMRSAFPLRHFWRWSTRPFTRAESRSSEHNGTTAEILAACRQILRQPLDDDVTRRAVVEYWTESGAADYDKTWRGRLELIVRVIEEGEIFLAAGVGRSRAPGRAEAT